MGYLLAVPGTSCSSHPKDKNSLLEWGLAMLKSELVARLASRYALPTRRDAEKVVDAILGTMSETLARGQRIELRGFGAFSVKHRAPRTGRNPRNGALVAVAAKRIPFFRCSKELRDRLNADDGSGK